MTANHDASSTVIHRLDDVFMMIYSGHFAAASFTVSVEPVTIIPSVWVSVVDLVL